MLHTVKPFVRVVVSVLVVPWLYGVELTGVAKKRFFVSGPRAARVRRPWCKRTAARAEAMVAAGKREEMEVGGARLRAGEGIEMGEVRRDMFLVRAKG
jgi:hypothetical protein